MLSFWPFSRKPVGMIRPGLALGFEDSRRIMERKSIAMVQYLRARRSVHDPLTPEWMRKIEFSGLKAARAAHFRLIKKQNPRPNE